LIKFVDEKINENKGKQTCVINGGFYNMNVNADYVKLKKKILAIKNQKLQNKINI
jgi:hypothetical protein